MSGSRARRLVLPSVLAVATVRIIASCSDQGSAPDAAVRDSRMLIDATGEASGDALEDAQLALDAPVIDAAIDASFDASRDAPPDTPA